MALTETEADLPSIAEFYQHKDIFITGATGFLGKCLLEKLLRSVPDIGKIMILMRPKKGKTVKERLDSIIASKVSLLQWELGTATGMISSCLTISSNCPRLTIKMSMQLLALHF